jgi:hypothetical protein
MSITTKRFFVRAQTTPKVTPLCQDNDQAVEGAPDLSRVLQLLSKIKPGACKPKINISDPHFGFKRGSEVIELSAKKNSSTNPADEKPNEAKWQPDEQLICIKLSVSKPKPRRR